MTKASDVGVAGYCHDDQGPKRPAEAPPGASTSSAWREPLCFAPGAGCEANARCAARPRVRDRMARSPPILRMAYSNASPAERAVMSSPLSSRYAAVPRARRPSAWSGHFRKFTTMTTGRPRRVRRQFPQPYWLGGCGPVRPAAGTLVETYLAARGCETSGFTTRSARWYDCGFTLTRPGARWTVAMLHAPLWSLA